MNYKFRATEQFWTAFYDLSPRQKESARRAWSQFKANPFHPSLGAHKIAKLSAKYKRTIYSVVIEPNLRAVFYIDDDTVITVDIGSHDIYKG